jgi:hypothetical protein
MTAVVDARDAYIAARAEAARTRRELGRAIREAREQDIPQHKIAATLKLTREQIRRYQREYELWLKDHSADA